MPEVRVTDILANVGVGVGGRIGPGSAVGFLLGETSGLVKKQTHVEGRASVCGACGYAELYAADPGTLVTRWRAGDR
jgi:hypothetical protein